ncbi:C4-dicarboxylate ABC transporter permease [bacterium]|nr:C4-dicarboxylate ABC transporter permease [bacterium]
MVDVSGLIGGIDVVFSLSGFLFVLLGVFLGILIGATPGLSPSMGVALLVPLSFRMEPEVAFVFFVAVYQASNYGGSITAILLNAPGTPSSVVTAMDGYVLTKKGLADKALSYAVFSSALGGLIGGIVLLLFTAPIAKVGLMFGPAEYFALALLGLCTVIGFHKGSMSKAFIALSFGLLLSTIGTDPITGQERMTFGLIELYDGVSFIPVMIGFFALGEIFSRIEENQLVLAAPARLERVVSQVRSIWDNRRLILRPLFQSSVMGTFIGVIPGAGSAVASFLAYGQAATYAKDKEEYGDGALTGVIASEAANSSSVGGALVPLVSLGIPGSATDAVLLGALALHGLAVGPELMTTEPRLVYGIFIAVLLANVMIFLCGMYGNTLFVAVTRISPKVLYPIILCLAMTGSFTIRNAMIDCWVCLIAGGLGWLAKRQGIPAAPIILGLVLGSLLETNFRRSILMGGIEFFFTKPLALGLLTLSLLCLITPFTRSRMNRSKAVQCSGN